MFRRLPCATLVALCVAIPAASAPAHATTIASEVSAFAQPMNDLLAPVVNVSASGSEFAQAPPDEKGDRFASEYIRGTRYESRYRPRRRGDYYDRGPRRSWRGVSQLHAGFLDPEGSADPGFVVGFRGGQQVDDMIQVGIGLDWRNKSGRSAEVLRETVGPGGETVIIRRDLSRYSSNLFPALLYLQVSGPSNMSIVPYAGFAGSWQVLFLEADDFNTGETFDATYDGFGWQLWGGAAIPLSGRSRLVGEVFMNQADLGRDVYDPFLGFDVHETVSTDGVGGRFGLSWGF
jgi:hypothetical protein